MKKKVIFLAVIFFLMAGLSIAKEREGIVTINVKLNAPNDAKTAKIWLPYPLSGEYQRIEDIKIRGNFSSSSVYREPKSGATYLFAAWRNGSDTKSIELRFKAKAVERSIKQIKETNTPIPIEVKQYLETNHWIPTDGEIKKIANEIIFGKQGILEKSRAVYDWVVENTFRDPSVKGCGLGIVEQTLTKRGGKCADISSVYVALARAAGVPAREVFGLRLGKQPEQDMTGGHHCWAEFYLPNTGWIPVDPADVRKIMLVNKLNLEQAKKIREYYFGSVDEYRIVLEKGGRGIIFEPRQEGGPLNYFMYPYAEVDGRPLDYLDPKKFSYSIWFKAL